MIKEQFIERDLFSAKSIEQIRWRIYGQNFTKEDLLRMLEENKDVIVKLPKDKLSSFFGIDVGVNEQLTEALIEKFVENNYNNIFR